MRTSVSFQVLLDDTDDRHGGAGADSAHMVEDSMRSAVAPPASAAEPTDDACIVHRAAGDRLAGDQRRTRDRRGASSAILGFRG